jgi:magnesium-transporting ATPase (P-type)
MCSISPIGFRPKEGQVVQKTQGSLGVVIFIVACTALFAYIPLVWHKKTTCSNLTWVDFSDGRAALLLACQVKLLITTNACCIVQYNSNSTVKNKNFWWSWCSLSSSGFSSWLDWLHVFFLILCSFLLLIWSLRVGFWTWGYSAVSKLSPDVASHLFKPWEDSWLAESLVLDLPEAGKWIRAALSRNHFCE